MRRYLTVIFILVIFVNTCFSAHLTDTISLNGLFSEGEIMLSNKNVEILEDSKHLLQIETVSSKAYKDDFLTNELVRQFNENINSTYWVKFYTKNLSNENSYIFDIHSPNVTKLTLYAVNSKGEIVESGATGIAVAFEDREYKDKNLLLNLHIGAKNDVITHYVKVEGGGFCRFNFCISAYHYFMFFSKTEFFLLGIFYGIVCIMMLYNLMMFISMRDKVYVVFILFLLAGLLKTLAWDRMGSMFIWSDFQSFSYIMGIYIAPNLIVITYIGFTISFLKLKLKSFNSKILIYSLIFYFVSYFVLILILGDNPNVSIFYFIPIGAVMVVSFMLQKFKRDISWYYLMGTVVFLLTIILTELKHQKIVFGGAWVVYSYHISLVIQSLLFSFSIFDRLKYIYKAKVKLIDNVTERDKTHFNNLKKIHYLNVVIDNLHAHFNMIVAPINKLILSVDSKNDIANEINTIKIHSRSILEIAQNKNNENFLDVSKQKIEVVSFARNICESFLGLAKNKNIKLEFSSNLVVFECELEQTIVEKILFNLILNSLNDSNQYEKVRLRIDIDELSKTICIELEDYGDGISEDEINSILSDDLNVETSSVGVGLNFIKYLAKKVHGKFNVESELKKGSFITVIIPFYLKAYDAPNILPQIEIVDMERKVSNEVIQEEINISEDIQEYNENVSSVQVEVIDKNFELFIANATKLVHENISDPDLDVEVFCKGLGVSRAQLYRKFKSYKQLTVKEFVKEIRLIKAGELLINSSMNVNEIMNDVGFQNRQYFAKCFKEYFNETPSSYKAKMKT